MSSEATKFYDLDKVLINFLGVPLDSMGGYAEGDSVLKIEKMDPNFTFKRGADGSVARSKTYSRIYTLTLSLLATAAANAVLSALVLVDEKASNGAGVGPVLVADSGGQSIFAGSESWLEGPPKTVEYGPQAGNREWTIIVADGTMFQGGN